MKLLVVGLLLAASLLGCTSTQDPAETVRPVSVEGDVYCSAVVVAPGIALTARHCLQQAMEVDHFAVSWSSVTAPYEEDIARLHVPGLKCPCAQIGARPNKGDVVVAIGYPQRLEGKRRTTESATVLRFGTMQDMAPWMADPRARGVLVITDRPILENGDSGGGLFVVQYGQWNVVGINSVGIPASPMPFDETEQASGAVPVEIALRLKTGL